MRRPRKGGVFECEISLIPPGEAAPLDELHPCHGLSDDEREALLVAGLARVLKGLEREAGPGLEKPAAGAPQAGDST